MTGANSPDYSDAISYLSLWFAANGSETDHGNIPIERIAVAAADIINTLSSYLVDVYAAKAAPAPSSADSPATLDLVLSGLTKRHLVPERCYQIPGGFQCVPGS